MAHGIDKLLEKKLKEGKHISPAEQSAKMHVLHDLKGHMDDEMADGLSGLKKVTVASNSQEGLEHGLAKAQEIAGHAGDLADAMHGEPADEQDPEKALEGEEAQESPEEEAAEEQEPQEQSDLHDARTDEDLHGMSEEELDEKLNRLMAHKEARKKGKK